MHRNITDHHPTGPDPLLYACSSLVTRKPERRLLMHQNSIKNMRETAKSLCQLWEDQSCPFCQPLHGCSFVPVTMFNASSSNKLESTKNSYVKSFSYCWVTFLSVFMLITAVCFHFTRSTKSMNILWLVLNLWAWFSGYVVWGAMCIVLYMQTYKHVSLKLTQRLSLINMMLIKD